MRSIMHHTNDITKYCACASAQKREDYNSTKKKPKLAAKDASMSSRMRYSALLRSSKTTMIISTTDAVLLSPPTQSQNVNASF